MSCLFHSPRPLNMGYFTCIVAVTLITWASIDANPLELEDRILGGVEIWDRCQAPFSWMVALQMSSPQGPVTFCAAAMLDNMTLVTSAKCIYQFETALGSPGVAVLGDRDRMVQDPEEQVIPIDIVRIHPFYNKNTYDNNIGLVRLLYPARLGRCVMPASKMEEDPNACSDMDTSCVMAGWGNYVESSRPTNTRTMRSASIVVYGDFVTLQLELNRTQNAQPTGALYAEALNKKQKACYFDWGGVVGCYRNGNPVLRGVIGEHNCHASPTPPVMVTDVSLYEQWTTACRRNWDSLSCTGVTKVTG